MDGFDILEAENASLRKGNMSLVGRVNRLTLNLQKADKLISSFNRENKVLQDQLKKNADYIMKLSGAHHDRT